MRLGEAQETFTENLARLLARASKLGYGCRLREVERTAYQQEEYMRLGKSATRDSNHLKSLAADIYFTKNGTLVETPEELGDYWESLHPANRWGGRFSGFVDKPHFETDAKRLGV